MFPHSTPSGSGASSSSAYPWAGRNCSMDWEAYDWSSGSWWEQPASSSAEQSAPPGDGDRNTWTSQRPRPSSPPRPRRGAVRAQLRDRTEAASQGARFSGNRWPPPLLADSPQRRLRPLTGPTKTARLPSRSEERKPGVALQRDLLVR